MRDLDYLGYKRVVLKSDQENAIKALKRQSKLNLLETCH